MNSSDINYFPAWLIESVCYSSVNCYILISGYYLSTKKDVNVKKVIELIAEVVFYSVGIYLLFCIIGVEKFNFKTLITGYLFPVTHGEYWFATVYIVSLFAVPYISRIIDSIDQHQYRKLLIIFGSFLSLIPTVVFFAGNSIGTNGGYSLIWFIYLYFLAGYFRKYSNIKISNKYLILGYIITSLLPFVVKVLQQLIIGKEIWDFYGYCSVPVVLSSVCLFLLIIKIQVKENKFVNLIGITTFGVFLIHTQYIMRENILWNVIVQPVNFIHSSLIKFIIHFVISIILIFFVCSIIDFLRDRIFYFIKKLIIKR